MAAPSRLTLTRPRLLFALLFLLLSLLFLAATLLLWRSAVVANEHLARSQIEMLVRLRSGDLRRGDIRAFAEGVGADFPDVFIAASSGEKFFESGERASSGQCADVILPLGLSEEGLMVTLCRPFAFRPLPFVVLGAFFILVSGLGFVVAIYAERRSVRGLADFFRAQGVEVDRSLPLNGLLRTLGELSLKVREARALEVRLARTEAYGELAAMVAHDIRAPLAAIKVTAKELRRLSTDSAERLERAAQRIEQIASDLLKKEAASAPPRKDAQRETINRLLEAAVSEFRGVAQEVHVELVLEVAPAAGEIVIGRPTEFRRVISNLLTNALEACLSVPGLGSSVIAITADEGDRGQAHISVSDTGKGIPPEILARLGERGATFGKSGGNGLGLYGAKAFAESAGGSLAIESTVGGGTTVTLALPGGAKVPAESAPDAVLLDDDVFVREAWEASASEARIKLAVYDNVEALLKAVSSIPKATPVYLDSQIEGSELPGEEIAKKLSDFGFSQLYLATGLDPENFQDIKCLTGVIGKDPPDWSLVFSGET